MLKMGMGWAGNQAWYSTIAMGDTDLCCLDKHAFDELTTVSSTV